MGSRWAVLGASLIVVMGSACSLLLSTSDLSGENDPPDGAPPDSTSPQDGSSTTDVASGTDGAPDVVTSCPSTGRGPTMVDTGKFCIDSTEVTQSQYDAFLTAGVALSTQPSQCTPNAAFLPDTAGACSGKYSPGTTPMKPVVCVDWCDARAFCVWSGKRLCGMIGGGSPTPANALDPAVSEFMSACTAGGTRTLPYGNTFDPQACNGKERNVGDSINVKSLATCEGGHPGLFDITGNVTEFDSSCTQGGGPIMCARRGGSFDVSSDARCTFLLTGPLDFHAPFVGFRCCADRL